MIDWTLPLQTVGGDKAKFICELKTDDNYPMLVIVTDSEGFQGAETYRKNGTYSRDHFESSPWDLQNIQAKVA